MLRSCLLWRINLACLYALGVVTTTRRVNSIQLVDHPSIEDLALSPMIIWYNNIPSSGAGRVQENRVDDGKEFVWRTKCLGLQVPK
ncbi:hypothetical protein F4804DRAFT_327363 [Jackrogersella minutella]|nr:hypothetical protein F4804DRAFT_327363 [Jackrogersella minutella]